LDSLDDTRRVIIDRLANSCMGYIAEHGHYLEPEEYKQLLIEVLDRTAGSLDFIGANQVELRPAEGNEVEASPIMVQVIN
jgi:hypothetical protein